MNETDLLRERLQILICEHLSTLHKSLEILTCVCVCCLADNGAE